jgi:hypothetical protein
MRAVGQHVGRRARQDVVRGRGEEDVLGAQVARYAPRATAHRRPRAVPANEPRSITKAATTTNHSNPVTSWVPTSHITA